MTASAKKNTATLALFSCTLFLSAALMFGLQPMIGKMLLPIVGGTPSGWIVAMAFFQVMLLAGYFLAHALSRYEARMQGVIYILCLVLGVLFLPASLARYAGLVSENPVAIDVFLLLTASVAVPFVALSATASTLQRLFTTTGHASAKDPYFLYVASNLGSFVGLLLYPFVIEPGSALTMQSYGWLGGYILLMVLGTLCLIISKKKALPKKAPAKAQKSVSWKRRGEWIVLSFLPSGLLLAVTTHITTDILSVPLLWVLPLSLYLLTFVIAFSKKPVIRYETLLKIQPVAAAIALALLLLTTDITGLSWLALALHLAAFTIIALMCHMRLAQARPTDDHSRHLTEFYLMMAVGGALGGILNAFIAPLIFNSLVEYPLILAASGLLNDNFRKRFSAFHMQAFVTGCALCILLVILYKWGNLRDIQRDIFLVTLFVLITLHPRMTVAMGILAFLGTFNPWQHHNLMTERNFYGVIKVYDGHILLAPGKKVAARYMQHGTTIHGVQMLGEENKKNPTAYFSRKGPLGDALSLLEAETIGVVGLGTGTINCYSGPKREITFFEIDPAVVKVAKEHFTYLSECGAGMPRIILGDARLEIKKLKDEKFDLIILDAFSSDAIPIHLLTKEAIEGYLQRLTPGGSILFHISNRFFRLDTPIAVIGKLLDLKHASILHILPPGEYATSSKWIVLSPKSVDLDPLAKTGWSQVTLPEKIKPWTDDYSNLLSTLEY